MTAKLVEMTEVTDLIEKGLFDFRQGTPPCGLREAIVDFFTNEKYKFVKMPGPLPTDVALLIPNPEWGLGATVEEADRIDSALRKMGFRGLHWEPVHGLWTIGLVNP